MTMNQPLLEKPFRAFFGIKPSEEILERIIQTVQHLAKKNKSNKIRWISTENLHITLTFLGNISKEQAQELTELLQNDFLNLAPFDVTFSSFLALPSSKSPRVLTLFATDAEPLIRVDSIIRHHAKECDIEIEERPYKPHITIARIKGKHHFENLETIKIPTITVHIQNVTLFRSDLTSESAIYTPIATIELTGV
jgi:2'-5' RNA ligase